MTLKKNIYIRENLRHVHKYSYGGKLPFQPIYSPTIRSMTSKLVYSFPVTIYMT
jgi:hypothetical protein